MSSIFYTFKRYPFLCVLQIVAGILVFPLFFSIMSFAVAITPDEAIKRGGVTMPADWEAGVMNHGQYYQWYSIEKHFLLFLSCLVAFAVLMLFLVVSCLYIMYSKEKSQPSFWKLFFAIQ